MDIMKRIGEKRFAPGKGVEKSSPKSGPARFFFLFGTYFWRLIGINMLFILCCIPVITIPASLCALNRYLIKMVRDGYGFSVSDYFKEFKAEILKSIPYGIICFLPIVYGYYLLSMSQNTDGSGVVFAFGLAWLFIGLLFSEYVFVLLPMLDLPFGSLMKDVLILIVSEYKKSLCVLLLTAAAFFIILFLFPYSLIAVGIFFISWVQLAVSSIINGAVQKRIIGVYEEKAKNASV